MLFWYSMISRYLVNIQTLMKAQSKQQKHLGLYFQEGQVHTALYTGDIFIFYVINGSASNVITWKVQQLIAPNLISNNSKSPVLELRAGLI